MRKFKGSGFLIISVIASVLIVFSSFGITKITQLVYNGFSHSKTSLQAQQYAEAEADLIKATNYDDLVAKNKTVISNTNGFCSEVTLLNESNYSNSIKQRIAVVKIYDSINAASAIYTLNVLKTSVSLSLVANDAPIGTIIAWVSSTAPNEGGKWLLCNGGTFSSATYPKLYSVLGKTTLPSLNGRFLEGTTGTPGSTKSAGLPNITGSLKSTNAYNQFSDMEEWSVSCGGAFSPYYASSYEIRNRSSDTMLMGFDFDASKSNSIYGASTTVQPASYLVRYYIKAS